MVLVAASTIDFRSFPALIKWRGQAQNKTISSLTPLQENVNVQRISVLEHLPGKVWDMFANTPTHKAMEAAYRSLKIGLETSPAIQRIEAIRRSFEIGFDESPAYRIMERWAKTIDRIDRAFPRPLLSATVELARMERETQGKQTILDAAIKSIPHLKIVAKTDTRPSVEEAKKPPPLLTKMSGLEEKHGDWMRKDWYP